MNAPAGRAVFIIRLIALAKIFMNLDGCCGFASRLDDGVFQRVFSGRESVARCRDLSVGIFSLFNKVSAFVEVI